MGAEVGHLRLMSRRGRGRGCWARTLRLRSLVSISSWLSLLLLSGPPSSSAMAHRPPLATHSLSKLSALSSGRGPLTLPLGLGSWGVLGGVPPPAALPLSACARISMIWARKLAMLA